MIKSRKHNSQWNYRVFWPLVFFLAPVLILAIFGADQKYAMLVSVFLFSSALPLFVLVAFVFSKVSMLRRVDVPQDQPLDKSSRILDKVLRGAFLVLVVVWVWHETVPFWIDSVEFVNHGTIEAKDGLVTNVSSSIAPMTFVYESVKLMGYDDQEFWMYFSPGRLKKGHRYHLEILPRSGIILTTRQIR